MRKIKIFDTTLRDGEQTPGVNFSIEQKIQIAKQLEKLNVDVIEAGFPITSDADFEACFEISKIIKTSKVCMLARLTKKDIDRAYEAANNNPNSMIHIFIATSKIHMEHKLKMNEEQILNKIKEMTTYAKTLFNEIEFSCEDASRSGYDFLVKCYQLAIDCGATTINIPDTVGFATPDQIYDLVSYLKQNIKGNVTFSIHIHQDLGLATASSLAAIKAGCDQVECAINGLGERAGNTALEEIVCTLELHKEYYHAYTDVNLLEINNASTLVATYADIIPQPNKAIIGRNAFLHESGIHQDGFLKARNTYEIIRPEMIGKSMKECLVVGKHSGKHAMKNWLEQNDYVSDEITVEKFFVGVKKATDSKKKLSSNDLHIIIEEILKNEVKVITSDYEIQDFTIQYIEHEVKAEVILKNKENMYRSEYIDETPIKAIYNAINKAINFYPTLDVFHLDAIQGGADAKASVEVIITYNNEETSGHALSNDILKAGVIAYLNAINKAKGVVYE